MVSSDLYAEGNTWKQRECYVVQFPKITCDLIWKVDKDVFKRYETVFNTVCDWVHSLFYRCWKPAGSYKWTMEGS